MLTINSEGQLRFLVNLGGCNEGKSLSIFFSSLYYTI